jgi:hypothetical protein
MRAKGVGYRKMVEEVDLGEGTVIRPTTSPGDQPTAWRDEMKAADLSEEP